MGYEEDLLPTDELEIGMYITHLDRPWAETPFPLQGFCIRSNGEIALLKKYCRNVYIDRRYEPPHHDKSTGSYSYTAKSSENDALPLPQSTNVYRDTTDVEQEMTVATATYENLSARIKTLFKPFQSIEDIDVELLEQSVSGMVESIIRNPEALNRLTLLKEKDDYTYNHSINMAIIAVVFGRHLGLAEEDLHILAWGALFCDVGKVKLPVELINKAGKFSDDEFAVSKQHIRHSIDLAGSIPNFPDKAIEIIQYHHERFDGGGYPEGLKGKEIPIFCRIVSIADDYDAMINERPYAQPISPHEAIRELYALRNMAYQAELIEAFIQAVGVYPLGTLVELNTGQVGVVISQNKIRHLKPKIMLALDKNKAAYRKYPILDLLYAPPDGVHGEIIIDKVLPPGAYGIKP